MSHVPKQQYLHSWEKCLTWMESCLNVKCLTEMKGAAVSVELLFKSPSATQRFYTRLLFHHTMAQPFGGRGGGDKIRFEPSMFWLVDVPLFLSRPVMWMETALYLYRSFLVLMAAQFASQYSFSIRPFTHTFIQSIYVQSSQAQFELQ